MQNLESMEARVVEIKQKTRRISEKTLEKIAELHSILQKDVQNSEEKTVSAIADAELGGQ